MSIKNPNHHDLERAYFDGLDPRVDVETAEDLGIPSTPETYADHVRSAIQGSDFITPSGGTSARVEARQSAQDYYNDEFYLTGAEPLSEQQKEINRRGLEQVRQELGRLGLDK